jgi:hypothetical protein
MSDARSVELEQDADYCSGSTSASIPACPPGRWRSSCTVTQGVRAAFAANVEICDGAQAQAAGGRI